MSIKILLVDFSEVGKNFYELQDILAKTNNKESKKKPYMKGFHMNRDKFTRAELEHIIYQIIWGTLSLPTEYGDYLWGFIVQGEEYNECPVNLDDEDELYYTYPDTILNFLKSCIEYPLDGIPTALGRAESKYEDLTVQIFKYHNYR